MKHTVRLERGLYVLMDSYAKPTRRSRILQHFPAAFCIFSIGIAVLTLHIVEQRAINACQPTQRAALQP